VALCTQEKDSTVPALSHPSSLHAPPSREHNAHSNIQIKQQFATLSHLHCSHIKLIKGSQDLKFKKQGYLKKISLHFITFFYYFLMTQHRGKN